MRSIVEIKTAMTSRFIGNIQVQNLYGLSPGNTFEQEFSIYSLENIFFDIFSYALWTLEYLFSIFAEQMDALIVANKHGKLEWYISTALGYQHGFELDNFGNYINGSASPEDIAASNIIANVAFEKAIINGHGVIRSKVVKLENEEYVQLSAAELAGYHAYINRKTLFGLSVISISRPHDTLRVHMKIWYDPLVLDRNGSRLDGTDSAPAVTAINAYLKGMDFNGEFIATRMIDALQRVQGVEIPRMVSANAYPAHGALDINRDDAVEEIYQTFAGWMRLDVENSNFEYIART